MIIFSLFSVLLVSIHLDKQCFYLAILSSLLWQSLFSLTCLFPFSLIVMRFVVTFNSFPQHLQDFLPLTSNVPCYCSKSLGFCLLGTLTGAIFDLLNSTDIHTVVFELLGFISSIKTELTLKLITSGYFTINTLVFSTST